LSRESEQNQLAGSLAFFGAVTASVSHELNNVISIIDQTAGLIEDMIAGEERGVPISIERLGTASATVRKQTGRGLDIIHRLNRFAHSADLPLVEFDVNEVLTNLVELTQRLASLKRADLVLTPFSESLKITANPFLLQQILFTAIRLFLTVVEANDIIEVSASKAESEVVAWIKCPREFTASDHDLVALQALAERESGGLAFESNEGGSLFSVRVSGKARDV
jgi:C4-dicarboxylate-specific signal transduction histidine kinase